MTREEKISELKRLRIYGRFCKNVIAEEDRKWLYLRLDDAVNMKDLFTGSFLWDDSKEGYYFWNKIYKSL